MTRASKRLAIGVAVALIGLIVATCPAFAASGGDGTSNTIQFGVTSAMLDQANHRVVITAPAPGGLVAGKHLASAEVVSPRYTIILENVLVSSVVGTSSSFSLNFANVNVDDAFGRARCRSGADACLIEEDGIYPPAA